MSIGALRRIQQIGRIGDDEIEIAIDGREQVAVPGLQVIHPGQRGIHLGEGQRPAVDVQRQHLAVRAALGDLQRAGTGPAADIHCSAGTGSPGRLQVMLDGMDEAIGVGAEEHRILAQGRESRVHVQGIAHARPADAAAPEALALLLQHLRGGHQLQQRIVQQRPDKGATPAEYSRQVARLGVPGARIDPRMTQRGNGGESVAQLFQRLAKMQHGVIRLRHPSSHQAKRRTNSRVA
ncbi:hypothetical protein D3C81_1032620 [compost metagenome]